MASRESAIKNNLNDRARKVGQFDELNTQDIDALIAFYDYSCLNCGKKPASSVDHVKPLSLGGTNTRDNLQLLCVNCNKAKQDEEIDYRNGKVVPDDFVAPTAQNKETYKKHDWDAIQHEYITTHKSMRELSKQFQVHENQLMNRAVVERWHKKRETFTSNLLAEANEDVAERTVKLIADEKFDVLKEGIVLYKDAVERWQIGGNKVDLHEIVDLWKPLAAALGEVTERTQTNVSEHADDAAILARINQAFDTGEESRSYTPVGDSGEEFGSGWTD